MENNWCAFGIVSLNLSGTFSVSLMFNVGGLSGRDLNGMKSKGLENIFFKRKIYYADQFLLKLKMHTNILN